MAVESLLEYKITESIIGAFYHVYDRLGYGFLEHVYTLALERDRQNSTAVFAGR